MNRNDRNTGTSGSGRSVGGAPAGDNRHRNQRGAPFGASNRQTLSVSNASSYRMAGANVPAPAMDLRSDRHSANANVSSTAGSLRSANTPAAARGQISYRPPQRSAAPASSWSEGQQPMLDYSGQYQRGEVGGSAASRARRQAAHAKNLADEAAQEAARLAKEVADSWKRYDALSRPILALFVREKVQRLRNGMSDAAVINDIYRILPGLQKRAEEDGYFGRLEEEMRKPGSVIYLQLKAAMDYRVESRSTVIELAAFAFIAQTGRSTAQTEIAKFVFNKFLWFRTKYGRAMRSIGAEIDAALAEMVGQYDQPMVYFDTQRASGASILNGDWKKYRVWTLRPGKLNTIFDRHYDPDCVRWWRYESLPEAPPRDKKWAGISDLPHELWLQILGYALPSGPLHVAMSTTNSNGTIPGNRVPRLFSAVPGGIIDNSGNHQTIRDGTTNPARMIPLPPLELVVPLMGLAHLDGVTCQEVFAKRTLVVHEHQDNPLKLDPKHFMAYLSLKKIGSEVKMTSPHPALQRLLGDHDVPHVLRKQRQSGSRRLLLPFPKNGGCGWRGLEVISLQ